MKEKHYDEIVVCEKCGRKFGKRMIIYISNCDEKRYSSYDCVYCGQNYTVKLRGNEDVESFKLDEE